MARIKSSINDFHYTGATLPRTPENDKMALKVVEALERLGGNQSAVARELGIPRRNDAMGNGVAGYAAYARRYKLVKSRTKKAKSLVEKYIELQPGSYRIGDLYLNIGKTK